MDDIDVAQEQADLFLSSALAEARKRAAVQGPEPTGVCLNCDVDLVSKTQRFCDKSCRDDWEHRERRRKVAGRPE